MKVLAIGLVLFLSISNLVDANVDVYFRYDYEYFENVDGWMKIYRPQTWIEALWTCSLDGGMLATPLNDAFRSNMMSLMPDKDRQTRNSTGLNSSFTSNDQFHSVEGDMLVTPLNDSFRTNMTSSMPDQDKGRYYPGLNSLFISKYQYHSVEGVPYEDIPHDPIIWGSDRPSRFHLQYIGYNETCVVMDADGHFTVNNCTERLRFMCYRNKTKPDILPCGSNDTEYTLRPCMSKSNITQSYQRYCNKFHKTPRIWSEAYKTCASEGAYLADIHNDEDAEFYKQLYAKTPEKEIVGNFMPNTAHIGFHNWVDEHEWITVRGQIIGNINSSWAPRHYIKGGGDCGSFNREGQFTAMFCDEPLPFFCEKRSNTLYDLELNDK